MIGMGNNESLEDTSFVDNLQLRDQYSISQMSPDFQNRQSLDSPRVGHNDEEDLYFREFKRKYEEQKGWD